MNDVSEYANEPGPGHYFGPESVGFSSLGKQKFSKCQSAPEVGFAKTGWDSWGKVRISGAHEKTFIGNSSPGHVYTLPDPATLHNNAPKIGTSLRPDLSRSLGVDPNGSPGPTINLRDTQGINAGTEPTHRVKKGFGLANRFGKEAGFGGIGPGQYVRKDNSLRLDNGRSIGTGRAAWEKVLTPGAPDDGKASLGEVGPPLWRDIKKEGSRGCPMGRAERFPRSKSESSGPGPIYNRDERDVARKKMFVSDTRNVPQTKFGKPPTKPRFRMMLALNCQNSGWGYF